MQAFVMLGLFLSVRKGVKVIQQQLDDLRVNVLPVVHDTKKLLTTVGPKIETVAADFAELTARLRARSVHIDASATHILQTVERQTSRLDTMLTNVLDTADRAGAVVADVMSVPLRQLSGIAAFARSALSTFRTPPPRNVSEPQPTHSPADKDLFV